MSQNFDLGPSFNFFTPRPDYSFNFLGGSLFSVAMVHHIQDPSPYGRAIA